MPRRAGPAGLRVRFARSADSTRPSVVDTLFGRAVPFAGGTRWARRALPSVWVANRRGGDGTTLTYDPARPASAAAPTTSASGQIVAFSTSDPLLRAKPGRESSDLPRRLHAGREALRHPRRSGLRQRRSRRSVPRLITCSSSITRLIGRQTHVRAAARTTPALRQPWNLDCLRHRRPDGSPLGTDGLGDELRLGQTSRGTEEPRSGNCCWGRHEANERWRVRSLRLGSGLLRELRLPAGAGNPTDDDVYRRSLTPRRESSPSEPSERETKPLPASVFLLR